MVIHNGVSLPPPPPVRLGPDKPLVLFVGRLEPAKNPERFLEAAALVPRRASRWPATAGCATRSRRGRATSAGARADARALMAGADLVLVSSDSEGQSLAVLEALAAGHAGGHDAGRRA